MVNTANLVFRVVPSMALVYLDDKLIGKARDFATENRYMIVDGEHSLCVDFPGYRSFEAEMTIVPNRTLYLDIELESISY